MRNAGIAFVVGGSISTLLFVGVKFGVDMYFRVAMRLEQKRETRTA